ncbi:hypothetical protein INT45_003929 [Circinella minor]|uniref:Uncharacterized protein n=1 Tax=Circinella minor TaxID=1195481 RepID=A0A8H7VJQ9_9FUNG|nr:hypothetical protein INT45_003929 [Circinella minor]
MLRVILSVLGISQIMIMTRDSLDQWRMLRHLKKEYLNSFNQSSSSHYVDHNDSNHDNSIDMTTPTELLLGEENFKKRNHTMRATTPTTPTITHHGVLQQQQQQEQERRQPIPSMLKEYARLVLELKTQEIKMIHGAKARMQGIASMPMVLCAVGFIPACISSLGILYSESATPIYNDYDQSIVGELLILLAIWCSFSILQTILWYRIVPSYVHRKVAHKLIKPVVKGGKKIQRPKIYHQRTLLQLLDNNNKTPTTLGDTTTYDLLEQYQQEIQNRKLDKKVIRLTNQMILLQFLYSFHDILSWLTYPVMLLFQIIILYFLWWWPKNDDYNISMRAQNMFSVWIFVINCILVLSAPSPRDDDEEDTMEEEK